ncbi:ribonuclease H-like domain-containing protein [Tanacetum coccineum]
MTLIEAARTMLADSFLPNTFWAEAVSTACYVLNRVLVTKPHNKTPYELVTVKIPIISYIRPFGCHATILNTIDHLGKFDGKSDEGFLVGYSLQSKAFRVYNLETKRVEENLHITFLENKPNVAGKGPTWLFDLDYLTDSMNYQPVRSENQANKHAGPQEANHNAGTQDNIDAGDSAIEAESAQDYFVLPIWSSYTSTVKSTKANNAGEEPTKHPDFQQVDKEDQFFLDKLERLKRQEHDANDAAKALRMEFAQETKDLLLQAGAAKVSSTNIVNTASTPVSTASPYGGLSFTGLTNTNQDDSEIHALEEIYDNPTDGIFTNSSYDDEGAVADFTNLELVVNARRTAAIQDSESLDSCRFALWEEGNWNKIGFIDPKYPKKVYKVVKALYGLHQAPRACQDKYVAEILKKFDFASVKTASTPIETHKPLVKDEEASDVNVTPKTSHLNAVKRIIRYLKGKPNLGLWFPRVSSFDLEAYSDSDYAGANLNRKSTTGESLGRALDGTEALLLPKLFILWLAAVSTDNAKLVPLGKDSTAIETLKKIPPRSLMRLLIFLREAPFTMLSLYITAKVAGKPVSISEASIRSDLLFDDADGIDSLPNQAIFDAIQLMGSKSTSWDQIPTNIATALMNVPVPLDHFPVNALTSKVFSFMVKKGKHFSGKVTPLFPNMLVQPTEDEGAQSERQSEPQPTPFPPHPNKRILVGIKEVTDQAKEIQHLKAQIKKLKKQAKPVITHHRAWMKSGRKSAKVEPLVHKNPLFDELLEDTLDYMETKNAQDVGRSRDVVNEEKETADDEVSTEDVLSTAQQKVSTDKEKVSTDRPNVSTNRSKVNTDREKDSTVSLDEGTEGGSATSTTLTTTPTMFGDDETIAQVLLNMSQAKAVSREKEKGVELKDVKNAERPRPTSTRSLFILKPLPKIDLKDKGKKKIEEEDESKTESEGEERKRLAKEEATNAALIQDIDDIKARIKAAQRRFLAEQRAIEIRNRPPTRTQLRNQMMTYLKHVGNKKHSDLKNKTFEEIQALYEKVKRFDESFTTVGSTEDERRIKEMNEGVKDSDQKSLKKRVVEEIPKKEDTAKVPAKCLKIVTFEGTMDSEIMERKSVIARLNKVISPDGDYLVIYKANRNFRAFNCLLEEILTWKLYEACGVYILELKDGTVIHMLVEKRYPLSKDLLQRMLDLGLEVKRERKSKKSSHQPKAEDTNQEKLYLLHMDLCGPMRVASINGKRTKDEAPEAIIKCIKNIQVRLNATVCNVRIDNGTEFVNQTLYEFYENVGISNQTSVARTPQQNGIVESALCYPTNDNGDLGKLDAKADIGIFIGYVPAKKAFRIYNKRTQKIIETIHVTFDELIIMASEQFSSGPGLKCMTPSTSSSRLVLNSVSQQPCIPPNRDDYDHLFQPMFDEYFTTLPIVITPVQEVAALRAVVLADSPMPTSINQDAPSSSTP